jgi:hypothetical protein
MKTSKLCFFFKASLSVKLFSVHQAALRFCICFLKLKGHPF